MILKELRKQKQLTQLEASLICDISLRTYKRLETDIKYKDSIKYSHAFQLLDNYHQKSNSIIESAVITVVGL